MVAFHRAKDTYQPATELQVIETQIILPGQDPVQLKEGS